MSTLIDPRKTFGEAVTELAEHDDRIVVLSADSGGSSGFGMFRKLYPDRYFEFGIQSMASPASPQVTTRFGFPGAGARLAPIHSRSSSVSLSAAPMPTPL